jgi:hypothetical protein
MAEHTLGPWRACKDGNRVCGYIFGDGGQVYVAQAINEKLTDVQGCPDPYPTEETALANLRLIVAAPAMLAMLEKAERFLNHINTTTEFACGGHVLEIRETIAKAKNGG